MLHGKKVILRPIEKADLPNYVRWFNDTEVLEYHRSYHPMTLADEEDWYEQMRKNQNMIGFAIEYQGRHIGGCGAGDLDLRNGKAEVGILIGEKELWDQGLGQDALRTLVDYLFTYYHLHRVYLQVFAENARGIHAYEKIGFVHEGRARGAAYRRGQYHDMLWMSILRDEWERLAGDKERVAN